LSVSLPTSSSGLIRIAVLRIFTPVFAFLVGMAIALVGGRSLGTRKEGQL
jgi:uncharacterized membrane protein